MPIYAYKCESCGHAKDVLQKISDPPLTDRPGLFPEDIDRKNPWQFRNILVR